jgi:hypothetical protein
VIIVGVIKLTIQAARTVGLQRLCVLVLGKIVIVECVHRGYSRVADRSLWRLVSDQKPRPVKEKREFAGRMTGTRLPVYLL